MKKQMTAEELARDSRFKRVNIGDQMNDPRNARMAAAALLWRAASRRAIAPSSVCVTAGCASAHRAASPPVPCPSCCAATGTGAAHIAAIAAARMVRVLIDRDFI